jgi:deoxycytidine triphosphate deaminase
MDSRHGEARMIEQQLARGRESFGLSSYGYDARVGREFKIFATADSAIVDPKSDLAGELRRSRCLRRAAQ